MFLICSAMSVPHIACHPQSSQTGRCRPKLGNYGENPMVNVGGNPNGKENMGEFCSRCLGFTIIGRLVLTFDLDVNGSVGIECS